MDGNPWTTLCPAPLAVNPAYPASPVTERRWGFGCVLFDTAVNYTPAIITSSVTNVSENAYILGMPRWLKNEDGKAYGVGYTYVKVFDTSPITMKAVADKIRNEGTEGRAMDGDRVAPNEDDRLWTF